MKTILSVLIAGIFSLTAAAQIPKLNSYSAAPAVLFLDFDGQTVQGTGWNWNGPIYAQPAELTNTAIIEIFNRVAEDYRIFNLNITTDSAKYFAAPIDKRSRIIVTPTSAWYGLSGGVSYVGSFAFGDDTPAWVFSTLLGNNIKKVAEAISHEGGHTLGLQHQSSYDSNCVKIAEYSAGQGLGEISWSPIMGVGYYRNLTTWHNGPNTIGCEVFQNDIDIIAGSNNNIGLRADDHGNRHNQATAVTIVGNIFQASGIVNTAADKDVFSFRLTNPTNFKLSAIPENVGGSNSGADVDLRVSLLGKNGDTLNRYNPSDLVNVIIDTTLQDGNYYLVVEGVGNANLLDYGSLGYYSLTASMATTLPVTKFNLTGYWNNGSHLLSWKWEADEKIESIEIQSSTDGKNFSRAASVNTDQSTYRTNALSDKVWYRLKAITISGNSYYSNIVALRGIENESIVLSSTIITNEIRLSIQQEGSYQLIDQSGKLLQKGKLSKGLNRIQTNQMAKGLLFLHVSNENETKAFKLIKQ